MQYYTILSVLAGAAAVSAGGLTDGILGATSLTGASAADGEAKGALGGLPTDELLGSGLTGEAKDAPEPFTNAAAPAGDAKEAKKGGLLDGLGLKQLYKPASYPYEDPAPRTTPTPIFVTRTVTEERFIPTVTARPPPVQAVPINNNTAVKNSGVESCSEGTATSCCDTKAASDGLLSNILGGSCALSNLNIPVLAVGGLSGSQCNNGNTFCCPINQDGNLNIALACIPLNL